MPVLLARRRTHLAQRPAHAAAAQPGDGHAAARADRQPGHRPRARAADALRLRFGRARCAAGARALAGCRAVGHPHRRHAAAHAGGHGQGGAGELQLRARERPLPGRIPVAQLERRRRAPGGLRRRHRAGLLAAARLCDRLRQHAARAPGDLPRSGVPRDGRRRLPRDRQIGGTVGRRQRRPALPERPGFRRLRHAGRQRARARPATQRRPALRPGPPARSARRAGQRRARAGGRLVRVQRRLPPAAPGGAHRCHRAVHGRIRRRQGALRAHAAPDQPAARQAVHRDQLRGHPRDAGGGGAVRGRARRLHRRHAFARRPLRAGTRRHPVPGRDRHPEPGGPGQAAARAAGRRIRARRLQPIAQGRHARGGRHQRRPAAGRARRALSPGPVLPPQRVPHPLRRCASGATTSRCS